MAHRRAKNRLLGCMMLISLTLGLHDPLSASLVEINGDKISIEANQIPMQEVLKQLSTNYGITVRIDPDINPLITVSFKNRDLEDGLKAMLKLHNHVFVWKTKAPDTKGTISPTYKLDEIHIFKPGQKDRMVNIQPPAQSTPADGKAEPQPDPEPDTTPHT